MANLNKKIQLVQALSKTSISNEEGLDKIGKIIRKEFDATEDDMRAFEMVRLAYHFNVPQLGEMLDDLSISDLCWLWNSN